MKPVQIKSWNEYLTPPDDNMKSIMLEKLSIVAARGGLEMEEKLKTIYGGSDNPACSFLWISDPDHQRYKEKIAEYTKSPPPPTPPAAVQNYDDLRASHTSLVEQIFLASNRSAMSLGIPKGMMRKELDIIKFTAQFVVRYGIYFWKALLRDGSVSTQFKFLDERDTRYSFVCGLFHAYGHLIRRCGDPLPGIESVLEVFFDALKKKQEDEGEDEVVDKVETDRRDFVVVCDGYFADIEYKNVLMMQQSPPIPMEYKKLLMMQPSRPVFRVVIPKGCMMRKELGILKFTAQFVVRYGNEFWDALCDRMSTETEFQFLKRNPGNDTLFSQLVLAYGQVIQFWGMQPRKRNNPARMEAVLKGFFTAFYAFKGKQEEERDGVVDKVVTDRRDFVVSDEYFQYFLDIEEHTPLPERLQMLHEKRVPKIITHPGPSTITISDSTGRVIQQTNRSEEEELGF